MQRVEQKLSKRQPRVPWRDVLGIVCSAGVASQPWVPHSGHSHSEWKGGSGGLPDSRSIGNDPAQLWHVPLCF